MLQTTEVHSLGITLLKMFLRMNQQEYLILTLLGKKLFHIIVVLLLSMIQK